MEPRLVRSSGIGHGSGGYVSTGTGTGLDVCDPIDQNI